jgi:PAS domain S-box-containing protein
MKRTDQRSAAETPPVLTDGDPSASNNGDSHQDSPSGPIVDSADPYRLLFESNPNPMWLYGLRSLRFLAVNQAAIESYGYSREEFLAMTIKDIRLPEDLPLLEEQLAAGPADRDGPGIWRHLRKDGSVIDVEIRSRAVQFGNRKCRLVMATDVTERLAADRRLRDSEERYRELFENASDIIYSHDMQGRYTEMNPAAKRIGDWGEGDAIPESVFDLIAPEQHEQVRAMVAAKMQGGEKSTSYEIEALSKDGRKIPMEVHSWLLFRDGEPIGVQGIARDITERKLSEEALRRSEERYRVVSDLISDYAYALRVEPDGSLFLEWITGAFTRDLGYTAEELNEKGLFSIVHPDDMQSITEIISQLGTNERTVREIRLISRSGATIWGRFYSSVSRDAEGKITYVYGAGQNVTDRKEAEEALQDRERALTESERRFRALIENSSEAIMLWQADATISYVTPSTARVLGYAENELIGRSVFDSIHRDDATALRHAFDFCVENPGKNVRGLFRVMRKDGTWRWIEGVGKNLLADPAVNAVVSTFRDVTERVNAEQELKSSLELLQKVDSERRDLLARLVNAQEEERERIALDIHDESIQVMTAISMRLEVLERRITDPAVAESARQLQDSVRRCVASLRELIFEVHPHALEQYGLVPALRQLLDKASREIGMTYEFEDNLKGEPPSDLRLVLYRICQESLTNILKHARASRVDMRLVEEEGGIRGTIGDDGVGFFPDEEASQPSAGHLGLAAMRARAETAGGWWKVDSTPGQGTKINFWVPISLDRASIG